MTTDIEAKKVAALAWFMKFVGYDAPTYEHHETIRACLQPSVTNTSTELSEAISLINKDGFEKIDPELYKAVKFVIRAAQESEILRSEIEQLKKQLPEKINLIEYISKKDAGFELMNIGCNYNMYGDDPTSFIHELQEAYGLVIVGDEQ